MQITPYSKGSVTYKRTASGRLATMKLLYLKKKEACLLICHFTTLIYCVGYTLYYEIMSQCGGCDTELDLTANMRDIQYITGMAGIPWLLNWQHRQHDHNNQK